jgi:hypothetical protein
MAEQQKPSQPAMHPEALEVWGRALERADKKHMDLDLVRRGRQQQAEAKALREQASSPKSR